MTTGQLERFLTQLPRDLNLEVDVHGISRPIDTFEVRSDLGRYALRFITR